MPRQRVGRTRPAPGPYRGPGRQVVPTFGVDVGGVIVQLAGDDGDTSFFGDRPLETPEQPGVFEALATLTRDVFRGQVHIVSKAGPKVAANTWAWLKHVDFFERTGMPAEHVHFVRERRDKAAVCERLGVTHFVDDRLDVLAYLEAVEHRYLFGASTGAGVRPEWATPVESWADLVELLIPVPR